MQNVSAHEAESNKYSHVLYITSQPSEGCEIASSYINTGLLPGIVVQNVDSLMTENVTIPSWLLGTPTIVDVATRDIVSGTGAIDKLKSMMALKQTTSGGQTATEAPHPPTKPPQEEAEGLEGVTMDISGAGGSWEETDDNKESGSEFALEVGCDPGNLDTGKVTDNDVQTMMKAREKQIPVKSAVN